MGEEIGKTDSRMIGNFRFALNPLVLELDIYSLAHHLCKM